MLELRTCHLGIGPGFMNRLNSININTILSITSGIVLQLKTVFTLIKDFICMFNITKTMIGLWMINLDGTIGLVFEVLPVKPSHPQAVNCWQWHVAMTTRKKRQNLSLPISKGAQWTLTALWRTRGAALLPFRPSGHLNEWRNELIKPLEQNAKWLADINASGLEAAEQVLKMGRFCALMRQTTGAVDEILVSVGDVGTSVTASRLGGGVVREKFTQNTSHA